MVRHVLDKEVSAFEFKVKKQRLEAKALPPPDNEVVDQGRWHPGPYFVSDVSQPREDDYVRKDGTTPMTGNLNLNGNKVVNLKAPTDDQDAVNKAYTTTLAGNVAQTVVAGLQGEFVKKDGSTTLTGSLDAGGYKIQGVGLPESASDAATRDYVTVAVAAVEAGLMKTNGTTPMRAALSLGGNKITNLGTPAQGTDAATKAYVDSQSATGAGDLKKDGTVAMAANFNVGSHKIINLAAPEQGTDAANKAYVDSQSGPYSGDLKKDGTVAMEANFDVGRHKIINLGAPTANTDGATKAYVDDNTFFSEDRFGNLNAHGKIIFNVHDPYNGSDLCPRDWILGKALNNNNDPNLNYNAKGKEIFNIEGTNNHEEFYAANRKFVRDYVAAHGGGGGGGSGDFKADGSVPMTGDLKMGAHDVTQVQRIEFAGGMLLGSAGIYLNDEKITHLAAPTDSKDAVNKEYIDGLGVLKKDGSVSMGGNFNLADHNLLAVKEIVFNDSGEDSAGIDMSSARIRNLPTPVQKTDAATKQYVDNHIGGTGTFVKLDGSSIMTGDLKMGGNFIENVWGILSGTGSSTFSLGHKLLVNCSGATIGPAKLGPLHYIEITELGINLNAKPIKNVSKLSMTGSIDMSDFRIANLANPAEETDAISKQWANANYARKTYVDDKSKELEDKVYSDLLPRLEKLERKNTNKVELKGIMYTDDFFLPHPTDVNIVGNLTNI